MSEVVSREVSNTSGEHGYPPEKDTVYHPLIHTTENGTEQALCVCVVCRGCAW